jgi:hypothetical protein
VVAADDASPAGANRIELILGDCVITGKLDQRRQQRLRGKTYNLQNADLHRWEQFWNDHPGGMIHFHGEVKDGARNYWTDKIPQKDGTKLRPQLQLIPSGKVQVRQFSQGSTDGGKTWKVEYDFL